MNIIRNCLLKNERIRNTSTHQVEISGLTKEIKDFFHEKKRNQLRGVNSSSRGNEGLWKAVKAAKNEPEMGFPSCLSHLKTKIYNFNHEQCTL